MKVRCIKNKLTSAEAIAINESPNDPNWRQELTVGKEYTVLGISYFLGGVYYHGVVLELQDDNEQYLTAPLCLFEVTDPRVSKFWRARIGKCGFHLWPQEFYQEYFHDDLSEPIQEVLETFWRVVERLEHEFDDVPLEGGIPVS